MDGEEWICHVDSYPRLGKKRISWWSRTDKEDVSLVIDFTYVDGNFFVIFEFFNPDMS